MIYKKKRGKKWFSRSYFFLIAGSAPMPGVGLVSCGVSWLGELVPVFWSMELELVYQWAVSCPVVALGCLWVSYSFGQPVC